MSVTADEMPTLPPWRVQALRSFTFVVAEEKASMPSASGSVGKTRMEVAQRSLTKMSRMLWSMKMSTLRSLPAAGRSGRGQR